MIPSFIPLCLSLILAMRIPYGINKHADCCDRYECSLILIALTDIMLVFYIPYEDMLGTEFRFADWMHFLAAVGVYLCALRMLVNWVREAGEVEKGRI